MSGTGMYADSLVFMSDEHGRRKASSALANACRTALGLS